MATATPTGPEAPKKSTLDTVANIAIIVTCVVALALMVNRFFFNQPTAAGGPPQAEVGEQFDQIRQVLPAGSQKALLVVLSPTCHFCDESMPFYKRLIDERNQKGSGVKIIAAVPAEEAKAPEAQKFAAAGVKPDSLVTIDFASIKVPGTPTVLLVDNQGKVLDVWVGKQDPGGEDKIIATL
jgi:thioredoxin-related protein